MSRQKYRKNIDEYYLYKIATGENDNLLENTGSFTTITAATAFGPDDNFSSAVSLDYTFHFGQESYDKIKVNTNGFLMLCSGSGDNDVAASATNKLETADPEQAILAPWWDDLELAHSIAEPSGQGIWYSVDGVSPTRQTTITWDCFGAYDHDISNNMRVKFQVVLYETSNIVEFRYGDVSANGSSPGESGASIGVAGYREDNSTEWRDFVGDMAQAAGLSGVDSTDAATQHSRGGNNKAGTSTNAIAISSRITPGTYTDASSFPAFSPNSWANMITGNHTVVADSDWGTDEFPFRPSFDYGNGPKFFFRFTPIQSIGVPHQLETDVTSIDNIKDDFTLNHHNDVARQHDLTSGSIDHLTPFGGGPAAQAPLKLGSKGVANLRQRNVPYKVTKG